LTTATEDNDNYTNNIRVRKKYVVKIVLFTLHKDVFKKTYCVKKNNATQAGYEFISLKETDKTYLESTCFPIISNKW